ncbi:MAG: MFS transporter [Dehalococcoidia bacterium]|nr:MFS transporter [Dehalococcoidia bacterium]
MLHRVLGYVKTQTTIRLSKLESGSSAATIGFTDQYLVPFAVAMRATDMQVGLLSSIPNLAATVTLLGVPQLVRKLGSRKAVLLSVVFLHAIVWLPVLLIPLLFPNQMILALLGFAVLLTVSSNVADANWESILADVVPKNRINRYFSMRGVFQGAVTLTAALIAGYVLESVPGGIFIGFGAIFFMAMTFRLTSFWFLTRIKEPALRLPEDPSYGFTHFLSEVGSSSVGRLILFGALMTLGAGVAAPFYAVYVLDDLHFSPILYSFFIGVGYLATIFSLPSWSSLADKIGNVRVVLLTAILTTIVPFLWLLSTNPVYLIAIQAFASAAWAGLVLTASNHVFGDSPPEKKLHFIAYFNALTFQGSLGAFVGPLLGGVLSQVLPPIAGNNLLSVFAVSGVIRVVVIAAFIPFMTEVIRIELPVPRGFHPITQHAIRRSGVLARVRLQHQRFVHRGVPHGTLHWAGQPLPWRSFRACRDCVGPSWALSQRYGRPGGKAQRRRVLPA